MEKRTALVVIARSAMTSASIGEMERLTARLASRSDVTRAAFAFTEQGEPSLRDVTHALRDEGYGEIVLVPLLLQMEPSYLAFLTRTMHRWRAESPGPWPAIRIGQHSAAQAGSMDALLSELADLAMHSPELPIEEPAVHEGSIVPHQRRRVLVCLGGPCVAAGSSAVWGHLLNEQKRLGLRTRGDGTLCTKTGCLGPCGLAPVLQVVPEGTYYGGIGEAELDRIVAEHLLEGRVVQGLAYAPSDIRQRLRPRGDIAENEQPMVSTDAVTPAIPCDRSGTGREAARTRV